MEPKNNKKKQAKTKTIVRSEQWVKRQSESQKLSVQKRIEAGLFISGSKKYCIEDAITQYCNIIMWLQKHKDKYFLEQYFFECADEVLVPYQSIKRMYKNPELDEYRDAIKKILEMRVWTLGAQNKLNSNMASFYLKNCSNWKDKSEQDITLSSKVIQFDFGNEELRTDNIIEGVILENGE